MAKIALVDVQNDEVVAVWTLPDGESEIRTRYTLPDGDQVSPLYAGWSNDGFAILPVQDHEIPQGHHTVGEPLYTLDGDVVVETLETAPVPEPTPVDLPLERWQFKAMVDYLGVGPAIDAAINGIEDPLERAIVLNRYRDSDIYRREDPLFDQIAPLVGLTPEQIDDAWMQIAGVQ